MTPRRPTCTTRALRRLRSFLSEALGSAIAARWAAGNLEECETAARHELAAALGVAEHALHEASALLVRLEESDQRTGHGPDDRAP